MIRVQAGPRYLVLVLGSLALAALGMSSQSDARDLELRVIPHAATQTAPSGSIRGGSSLVLDDGTWEGTFQVTSGGSSQQFVWFNQFTVPSLPFRLDEIQVLFPSNSGVPSGGSIQLVVWLDPDGDPANGANLVTTVDGTVQTTDGSTFSVYPLGSPTLIQQPGDLLIGVVPRFITSGVTPDTVTPAALDTTTGQGRSWFAVWTGDPPDPPALPPDAVLSLIDDIGQPGNWMIRASGAQGVPAPGIPVAGGLAIVVLILVMAGVGVMVLRNGR